MIKKLLSFLPRLWTNWITLLGSIITSVAGCTLVLAFAAAVVSSINNPYMATLAFLVAPAMFICGLVLIPIGLWWERFKRKRRGQDMEETVIQKAFRSAFEDKSARRKIFLVGFLTFINLLLVGGGGYHALHFMDSPEFCGTLCHSVMEPEYNAYIRSPHSRVKCVDCHIGSGASWAVQAKISGLRQVWAVMTDSFSKPIPAPVKHLRPARDTCEQCHWPAKFHGNRVKFKSHYADDEENTPAVSAVLLKVGGEDPKTGAYHGIHWHVSPDVEVYFDVLDDKRENVGRVAWKYKGELKAEYKAPGKTGEVKDANRLMDCVDCHNRPTHIYDETPKAAVDRAFTDGQLNLATPFLHEMAVKVLARNDIPRAEAVSTLTADLKKAYAESHPDAKVAPADLERAGAVLGELYKQNIYPDLKIAWDTYPNHLGHRGEDVDTRGCFRCHDEKHETDAGDTLSQDCDLCHEVLHEEDALEDIPESLRALIPGARQMAAAAAKKAAAGDEEGKAADGDEAQDEGAKDAAAAGDADAAAPAKAD